MDDPRPILDWPSIVRQRAVVYCGFDALTDSEVAAAVAQGMLADWVGYAGELYKHGLSEQQAVPEAVPETCLHLDEFAELARGPEIIQALNKGRGAGLRFSLYTQTLADIAAGLGNRDRAGQVIGNVSNTLVMLRVADLDTADLLVKRLGKVEVDMLMQVSGATDSSDPDSRCISPRIPKIGSPPRPSRCWTGTSDAVAARPGVRPHERWSTVQGAISEVRDPPDRLLQPSGTHRPRHGPPVPAGHRDGVAIPGFDPLHRAGVHASPGTRTGRSRAETRAGARRIGRIETRVGPRAQPMAPPHWGGVAAQWYVPAPDPDGSHRNGGWRMSARTVTKPLRRSNPAASGACRDCWISVVAFLTVTLLGWMLSIVLEWCGIAFGWWDQPGPTTARGCCRTELSGWIGISPRRWRSGALINGPIGAPNQLYHWAACRGSSVGWLPIRPPPGPVWKRSGGCCGTGASILLAAAYITAQLVGARAGRGGADPARLRHDRRDEPGRWSGGGICAASAAAWNRDSLAPSSQSHARPMLSLPIFLYLISLWSLHPTTIFVPFVLGFGYFVQRTVARFKKYL